MVRGGGGGIEMLLRDNRKVDVWSEGRGGGGGIFKTQNY
jgi:hypothetical protein